MVTKTSDVCRHGRRSLAWRWPHAAQKLDDGVELAVIERLEIRAQNPLARLLCFGALGKFIVDRCRGSPADILKPQMHGFRDCDQRIDRR